MLYKFTKFHRDAFSIHFTSCRRWLCSGSKTTSTRSKETVLRLVLPSRTRLQDEVQITLFGESAGAGAVSVHLVSPISRYFQSFFQYYIPPNISFFPRHIPKRAVLQSGAVNAPWSNLKPEKSIRISNTLIADCGCKVGDSPAPTPTIYPTLTPLLLCLHLLLVLSEPANRRPWSA